MKRFFLFISLTFSIFCICSLNSIAFSDHPPVVTEPDFLFVNHDSLDQQQSTDRTIQNAISSGNSNTLASFFFTTIELSIPDAQGSYSKAQAELLMKNFFSKHSPKSFSIINEGLSGGEKSRFVIGTYATEKGESFRVYYLIKEISGRQQLTILKFE